MWLFLNMGGMEWVLIVFAVLLLFGGKKIPELMKGFGYGIKELKKAKKDVRKGLREGMEDAPKKEKKKEDK